MDIKAVSLRAQGVSSPAARARKKSTEIDSSIYSLGSGNRETRVDFFALSIPILSYNSCFCVSIFCPPKTRAGLVEYITYSLGLESKGRKNRLEFLDFQTLSYKYRNQFRSIFCDHAPLGWKHPEHEGRQQACARQKRPSSKNHKTC